MEISLLWTSFVKAAWIQETVRDYFFLPQKEGFNIDQHIVKCGSRLGERLTSATNTSQGHGHF